MTVNKLPIAQISKLADDVRLIKDFAENHNFDASLLTANVTPPTNIYSKFDLPLISMVSFILLVLCAIAVIKLWEPPLSPSVSGFMFIIGLAFSIIASIAAHIRFQDKIVTSIVVIGLLMVLFIGAGIFTPEEAVDKVGNFAK
jgi:predicted membrane channel-forming protein YqfA (hemolysin III family)